MINKEEEKEANNERWLLTYSDLITLLMIFFVIMYATSNVDASKYKKMYESFKSAFGGGSSIVGQETMEKSEGKPTPIVSKDPEQQKMNQLKNEMDNYLKSNNLDKNITTKVEERGLVVSLNDTLFFESGQAEVRSDTLKKLVQIGNILKHEDNYVRIEGNTDNQPINNDKFKSNWQLSAIRAANVVQLLIEKCGFSPEKLSSVGYGEYRPVADNKTEEGRAKNRRIDIVIMNNKFNKVENN